MNNYITLLTTSLLALSLSAQSPSTKEVIAPSDSILISALMDNWHLAAAHADEDTYFNSMTDDAIFLGTDKTERWEKKVFEEWAQPHFDKDKAWEFKAHDRMIYFDKGHEFAWFEELLDTWMGTCRGSGVLIKTDKGWKIKHYNLALLVDNDKMDAVIEVCKKEKTDTENK